MPLRKFGQRFLSVTILFMLAVAVIGCGSGGGGGGSSAPAPSSSPPVTTSPPLTTPPTVPAGFTAVARVQASGPVAGQRWVDFAVNPASGASQYFFTVTRDNGTLFSGPVQTTVPWWSVALPIYEAFLVGVEQQNSVGLPLKVGQQIAVVAKPGDPAPLELRRLKPITQVPGWNRQHRVVGEVPGTSENPHAAAFAPGYPMASDGDDRKVLWTALNADENLRFKWNAYSKDDQNRDVWADAQDNRGLLSGYSDGVLDQTDNPSLDGGGNLFFRHLTNRQTLSP